MMQRAFQLPFLDNNGVTAAEDINLWLEVNPEAHIQTVMTVQCGCDASLVFGITLVPDDFEGLLPGEDYFDDETDDLNDTGLTDDEDGFEPSYDDSEDCDDEPECGAHFDERHYNNANNKRLSTN